MAKRSNTRAAANRAAKAAPAPPPPAQELSDDEPAPVAAPQVTYFIDPKSGKRMKRTLTPVAPSNVVTIPIQPPTSNKRQHSQISAEQTLHVTPAIDAYAPRSPQIALAVPPVSDAFLDQPYPGDLDFDYHGPGQVPQSPSLNFYHPVTAPSVPPPQSVHSQLAVSHHPVRSVAFTADDVSTSSSDETSESSSSGDDAQAQAPVSLARSGKVVRFEESASSESEADKEPQPVKVATIRQAKKTTKAKAPAKKGDKKKGTKGPGRLPLYDPATAMSPADSAIFNGLCERYRDFCIAVHTRVKLLEQHKVPIKRGPNLSPKVGGERLVAPTCREGEKCIFGVVRCAAANQINKARKRRAEGDQKTDILPPALFTNSTVEYQWDETLVRDPMAKPIEMPKAVTDILMKVGRTHHLDPLGPFRRMIRHRKNTLPAGVCLLAIDYNDNPDDALKHLPVVPNLHGMGEQLNIDEPWMPGHRPQLSELSDTMLAQFMRFSPDRWRITHTTHFVVVAGTRGGIPEIISRGPYMMIYWTYTNVEGLEPREGEAPGYWRPRFSEEKANQFKVIDESICELSEGTIYAVLPSVMDPQVSSHWGLNSTTPCHMSYYVMMAGLAPV